MRYGCYGRNLQVGREGVSKGGPLYQAAASIVDLFHDVVAAARGGMGFGGGWMGSSEYGLVYLVSSPIGKTCGWASCGGIALKKWCSWVLKDEVGWLQ
jgi:hypothetical protein